jgi:hypothetical protein
VRTILVAALIGACLAWIGMATPSRAQTSSTGTSDTVGSTTSLLPADREEIADQERLSWSLKKFPPQPYMNEFYWQFPSDTPAFFRDSLLQFVAHTYYLTRDNFDGSKSQAWTAGGWIAYRSGLIGDLFGVHTAFYTSMLLASGCEDR